MSESPFPPVPNIEDVTQTIRSAVYTAVGLGAMAFQQAQVRRREISQQVGEAGTAVENQVKLVEERLEAVEERLDVVLDDVEARLPDPAREAMHQARIAAKEARSQLRQLIASR